MRTLLAFVFGFLIAGLLLQRGGVEPEVGYNQSADAGLRDLSRVVRMLEEQSRKLEEIEEKLGAVEDARFDFVRVPGVRDLVRFDRVEGRIAFFNNRTNTPFWGTPIIDETPLDANNSFFREYVNDIERLYKD